MGISWVAKQVVASQEGLGSIEVVILSLDQEGLGSIELVILSLDQEGLGSIELVILSLDKWPCVAFGKC
jgi:hypothetical protein